MFHKAHAIRIAYYDKIFTHGLLCGDKKQTPAVTPGSLLMFACKFYTSVFSTSFILRTASADALNLACSALSSL